MAEVILKQGQELTVELLQKILREYQLGLNRMTHLEQYYLGQHDILLKKGSNVDVEPIVCSFPKYITDTLVGYFVGEPVTYNCDNEEALEELNNILDYTDAAAEDNDLAKDASIFGVAYELMYIDEDNHIRIARVSPLNMVVIYDDTVEHKMIYAIRIMKFHDISNNNSYHIVEVYSDTNIKMYHADELLNTFVFENEKPHFFGLVPVMEYKNNSYEQGDFEPVMSLIDAYDDLATNSIIDSNYFTDAYLTITGTATPTSDELKSIKDNRLMCFPDDTAHADFLVKPDNGTSMEALKDRIQEDIHKFSMTPNMNDQEFMGNSSGIALKYKLYGVENLVSVKERYFKKGLQKRIELIFNISNLKGGSLQWRDIEIAFHRNLPVNDEETAAWIAQLQNIVSRETLLGQLSFVDDVQAEMDRIEKEREQDPFYNVDIEKAVEEEEAE